MADEFYILSLSWTREDVLTWWGANNSGYTSVLDDAGRYSRAQVERGAGYYNNGVHTIAIPCVEVEAEAVRVVSGERLEKLTKRRFLKIMSEEGEACPSCGEAPHQYSPGIRVVGEVSNE